jgi:diguanylate cyclase (GGDEF)-like protein
MNEHLIQLYDNDNFLIAGLTDYIGAALASGDKGIVIATEQHLRQLEGILKKRGLLNDASCGRYIPLEAGHMLPLFMSDGLPDEARFEDAIGDVIASAVNDFKGQVYVFGEMVAILCGPPHCPVHPQGKHDAALQVERHFNKLLGQHSFTLMCGYPLSAFPKTADRTAFDDVCALHSMVLPAESFDTTAGIDTLQRTIATLQQQAYSLASEVHDRLRVEQALHEINFDRLTGLPNRSVFHDRLEMDIKKAHRSRLPLALLFIDLDHFKEINDTLGHNAGDLLLKQVGQRLSAYLRETDTVARLGGDEFTITLGELQDMDMVSHVAQNILRDLAAPFHFDNTVVYITASIGITLYPQDAAGAGELLRNADQAMYWSKDMGRNRFTYFTGSMQEVAQARMALSNDLRNAIGKDQLHVFYQPIVDMTSGNICKAEALIRWLHPAHGLISPVDFIPVAEHTGLIVTIGDWVFHEARRQAAQWRDLDANFTVSVNVSPAQFYRNNGENYHDWLKQGDTQQAAQLPVDLEITEGLLLTANASVMKQMRAFHDAGIKMSLDDFGTGYSSLSYLRKFNLDFLKIDRSFVYNLELDPPNVALCEAIIVMAHKLGLKVIAEGVETWQQFELLRHAGCDFAQGYLFGRAVPPDEFEGLLKKTGAALIGA